MTFVAAVVLIAGVLAYILYLRPEDLPEGEPVSPVAHLEERKARIYEGLRDLQFEYRLGKLSDADYQRTKVDLQRDLAAVMAEMDRILAGATAAPTPSAPSAAETQTLELPAAPKAVCPKCSAKFDKPMKFCGECGEPMQTAERAG
jgi:hypothetical protein